MGENESDLEAIAKIIFMNEELKSEWLESPHFASYLFDITGCKIDKCVKEVDRLEDEIVSVYEQTRDLAFKNYPSFIQTANCSRDVFSDFGKVEECLEIIQKSLPILETKCQEFSDKANHISCHRKLNSLTLDKHPQLLEVLELPQLMETCVKNSYYEEALDLISHVKRMGNKHGQLTLINNMVKEVQESTYLMLNQLLAQLRTNIQLPQCLKVIGYLRRLNIFTESQLRVKFLQARNSWFAHILSNIPKDDAYFHITKTIELSRIHLFDIITQYRAIFSDDDTMNVNVISREKPFNDKVIFTSWVLHKVQDFLQTLECDLEKDLTSRLDSLLGQCMYFGLSFSRVGADFRMLLVPLFIKASLKSFEAGILLANHAFEDEMLTFTVESCFHQHFSGASDYYSQDNLQPPFSLMEFMPLAGYCNNVLVAFNNLRLCCPLAIVDEVTVILSRSLIHAVNIILAFHRQQQESFTAPEVESFRKLCFVLSYDMIPFLNRCLQALFPLGQLSSLTGIPMTTLQKQNVGSLNMEDIIAPVKEIVPMEADRLESQASLIENEEPNDDGIFFTVQGENPTENSTIDLPLDVQGQLDSSVIPPSKDIIQETFTTDPI